MKTGSRISASSPAPGANWSTGSPPDVEIMWHRRPADERIPIMAGTAMPLSLGVPSACGQATPAAMRFSNGRHSLSPFSSWRDGHPAVPLLKGADSASPSSPSGRTSRSTPSGALAYSLIEVLIAAAILVVGISAAAILANAILVQEESNGYSLRAFNAQEQAARLWQLGLSPATITNILPERCSTNATNPGAYSIYLGFSNSTTNLDGVVTVEILNPLRIVFHSGFDSTNNPTYRTNDIRVVRPTNR